MASFTCRMWEIVKRTKRMSELRKGGTTDEHWDGRLVAEYGGGRVHSAETAQNSRQEVEPRKGSRVLMVSCGNEEVIDEYFPACMITL